MVAFGDYGEHMSDLISILIPARDEPYLNKTVNDLFQKAFGEIEVVVLLDGYWPNPPLDSHDGLKIIHLGKVAGMRPLINMGARVATGKYLMKCDAHCMFARDYDIALKEHFHIDWLAVPRRYRLDADNWKKKNNDFIDYMYLTYQAAAIICMAKACMAKNGQAKTRDGKNSTRKKLKMSTKKSTTS